MAGLTFLVSEILILLLFFYKNLYLSRYLEDDFILNIALSKTII